MSLTQQRFLGASIRGWNANIGWGQSTSECTVRLVEDPDQGDIFNTPGVGRPVQFDYSGWIFNGILQNYTEKRSFSGNRELEAVIIDPREILSGVQVILDGYNGSTYGVPNLYNVYGYLENLGFGGSGKNSSGMQWATVVNTLLGLVSTTPIKFRGYDYYLNLNQLPPIPGEYRIASPSLSVMDLVNEICDAGSCDYFFTLVPFSWGNVISLATIARNRAPWFGRISQYVDSTNTGAIQNNNGFELAMNVTSKFIVGGSVEQLYYNHYQAGGDGGADDTIWPFWGFDNNGNTIVGDGEGNEHTFVLDGRGINVFGDWSSGYPSDVFEMRAALGNQEAWEQFLLHHNDAGTHAGKATRLLLDKEAGGGSIRDALKDVENVLGKLRVDKIALKRRTMLKKDEVMQEALASVYEFVRGYATEYYGRKFMVRIPFVYSKVDSETGSITTSLEPTDSGFVEESLFAQAVGNGLLPFDINKVSDQNNKITAFVRFNRDIELDVSRLNDEDYIVSGTWLFVKCTVEPNIVYLNSSTGYSPRVVITLPGAIVNSQKGDSFDGLIRWILDDLGILAPEIDAWLSEHGSNMVGYGLGGETQSPTMAAIPLRSNILSYGPWYAVGDQGKTEFVQNEQLVPWNFGGFGGMNLAGQASVRDALTNYQVVEKGNFDLPGIPGLQLGQQLLVGGPYVTGLNVSVDVDAGIKSSYRLETWPLKPGRLNRWMVERIQKMARLQAENKRRFRQLFLPPKPIYSPSKVGVFRQKASRRKMGSSHHFIMSNLKGIEDDYSATVVSSPTYNVVTEFGTGDYSKKSGMSLDGLVRPFSTDTGDSSGMMKYEAVETGSPSPTRDDIDPFSTGHDVGVVVYGDEPPETPDFDNPESDKQRPVCIKGPPMIGGFGYSHDGFPIPNENDAYPLSEDYIEEHKKRMDLWKIGPLAAEWDDERQVWTGGTMTRAGYTSEITAPSALGKATTFTLNVYKKVDSDKGDDAWDTTTFSETLTCYNRDPTLEVDDSVFCIVAYINYEWIPVWVGCE